MLGCLSMFIYVNMIGRRDVKHFSAVMGPKWILLCNLVLLYIPGFWDSRGIAAVKQLSQSHCDYSILIDLAIAALCVIDIFITGKSSV